MLAAMSRRSADRAAQREGGRTVARFPIYNGDGAATPEPWHDGAAVGESAALSELRQLDTQVKDLRPTEDRPDPPAARACLFFNFRFTTFERSCANCRDQAQWPPCAVRSRQAAALGADRVAQAPGRARAHRPGRLQDGARTGKPGRERVSPETVGEMVMETLRALDDVAYEPLRLGVSQFPRGQGFRGRTRRIVGRGGCVDHAGK